MPSKGTRSKDVSPVPSSEPRAPTHKSSHTSSHCAHNHKSKKPDTKSRGSKTGSNAIPGTKVAAGSKERSKKEGSKRESSKKEAVIVTKRSHEYDVGAPPSRDDHTALESTPKQRSPVDFSLFPYAFLGFIFGLLVGIILVLFFGFCCCIFSDWRSVWDDRRKRAFLGGFATGVLIAIIVYVALFIALAVG